MKYLLDTHILIWVIEKHPKLSKEVLNIIDTTPTLFVSIESLREIAIKHKSGDIKLKTPFTTFIKKIQTEFGIKIVNTELNHVLELYNLTERPDHKDPFDHIIISTAIKSKFTLISSDGKFPFYRKQNLALIEN